MVTSAVIHAEETITIPSDDKCAEKVRACEEGLVLADLVIQKQAEVLRAQEVQLNELDEALLKSHQELESKDAWYKSNVLWLAVGIVSGVLVTK